MTALLLKIAPWVVPTASGMQGLYRVLLRVVDALAEARMRSAQREIACHSRWMQAGDSPRGSVADRVA
jgi:hypothetical protein